MVQVGSIVTIIADCALTGQQGEVVEIVEDGHQDGNIAVRVENPLSSLPGQKVPRFKEEELRVDADWTPEIQATRLFRKNGYHTIREPKEPFSPEKDCSHADCPEKNTRRVLVNFWGSVYLIDLCDAHAEKWHGRHADTFPFRKHRPAVRA